MEKYTNEELLEILPSSLRESKELTAKQKVVLGQLVIYNGLEIVKKDGYFYRSNKDLCSDCEIQEKTLIAAVRKLESLGFIERKKGTRTSGASEYRINEKLIGDYCKKQVEDNCNKVIEDYGNDYSKQIAEMSDRIKELENTVKKLVERITVIEGKKYITESEKELELDKEIDVNKNKLNNNFIYNYFDNIDENCISEELELAESPTEVGTNEGEQTITPTSEELELAESPTEVGTNEGEQTITPTSEDRLILKQCNNIVNPYLLKLQAATSKMELDTIKNKLFRQVTDYINSIDDVSDWVIDNLNERVTDYLDARAKEIEELHTEQITKQLHQLEQYTSYYC